jgi:glycosyltransferase involved in cell wall biosynthesis/thymidylate kinase
VTVAARTVPPLRVAYVMSRFPKLTETFIVSEILAVEALGVRVDIHPLLRQRDPVVQPDAARLAERARYQPLLSRPILRANLRALARSPRAYLGALATLVRSTAGSRAYLVGGLGVFPMAVRTAELLRARGVDHVHCHFSSHPAVAGWVIGRLAGIPWSFTAHGSDLHRDRHMLCEKVREAAFAVAISEHNRDVIVDTCGPEAAERVRVIHAGIDLARFPVVRRPPGRELEILCVGTLHEVKGQRYLLDACRRLCDAGVPFRCTFVGDGEDRPMLERLAAELGLGEAVSFAGALTSDEVRSRLAASDVLVAPSVPSRDGRREGIPVVLMEAMASGLPVVASRLSGIPELVEDGTSGLLTPPGDVDAIALALARLAADPKLRARLGDAGRATVEAGFSADGTARALVEAFEAVRERGRPPGRPVPDGSREASRPVTVALIGPDGAGKTTVGRRLVEELGGRATYLYMGINPDSGNRLLPTTRAVRSLRRRLAGAAASPRDPSTVSDPAPAPRGVRGTARALASLANRLAEEWYRQVLAWSHLRRGRSVIFDRHYLADYYATDIAHPSPTLTRRLHGLALRRLYPRPDLLVYLDAPPELLLARKGEGTIESLERRRSEYLAAGRLVEAFRVVDASAPIDQVTAEVVRHMRERAAIR